MKHDRTAAPWRRVACWASLFLALAPVPALADPATPSLEVELFRQAKDVLKKLRDRKYNKVGVLPFQADKTSTAPAGDDGSLGRTLAQRLEVALVLAIDPKSPVGILQNAAARTAKGADLGTPEGRTLLFGKPYPLAWGKEKEEVKADAFLSGVFKLSDDQRELTVTVQAYKEKGNPEQFQQFTALAESGPALLTRGTDVKKHPLGQDAGPVQLVIRYDDRPVTPEFKNLEASVGAPESKQKVSFLLKRKPGDRERYAVVLKLRGENVVLGETLPDLDCTKIVLEPEKAVLLRNFLTDDKKRRAFRLEAPPAARRPGAPRADEPAALAITVFRQSQAAEKENEGELAAIRRGQLPSDQPTSLADLKEQLRKNGGRGVLVDDAGKASELRRVEFWADPGPVISATVRVTREKPAYAATPP
jgi:hypothetical protein